MNNKKTLFMSLVIVLLVGLMVSAGTFAYFQWTTDVNQRTNVNVTIAAGGIKMIMTPSGGILEAQGLKPVADCMESYAYFDTQIQIQNTTGSLVVPSFKLKARVKPNSAANAGTLKKSDLAHIHYTVVEIDRIGQEIKTAKADNTGARRCYEPSHIQKDGTGRNGLFVSSSNDGTVATGTFANMSQVLDGDGWTSTINLPSSDNVYLARQYNDDPVKGDLGTFGITFMGAIADSTGMRLTNRYFRVYVWIDEGYQYTNAGTNMADPMQNAIIEVTWSEDSIVQQVSGELPGGNSGSNTVLTAGLYDSNGNFTSWDELVDNGDITLSGTTITASNSDLTGELVIPEGITEIGEYAFVSSSEIAKMPTKLNSITIPASVIKIGVHAFTGCEQLNTVTFAPNSQLTTIGEYAFVSSNLTSIEIPASVTSIGTSAFRNCEQLNTVTFAPNSQLATIGDYAFSESNLTTIEIPAGVTSIESSTFANCEQLNTVTFAPSSQLSSIRYYAFASSNLTSIEIPVSVTSIGQGAFSNCEQLNTITYSGTRSQWNAIDLYVSWNTGVSNWNENVPATYVQCSDGTVSLE